VWELYHLSEVVFEDETLLILNNSAWKVIKNAIKHAWYQSITYYSTYRRGLKHPMNTNIVKDFHLTKEQYLLGEVDWLVNDAEAWDSLCEWWASPDFRAGLIEPERTGRTSRVVHHYDAYVHVRKVHKMVWYSHTPILQLLCIYLCIILDSLLQKASTGAEPHYLDVWVPCIRMIHSPNKSL
jgi:hypothetical protein